MEYNSDSIFTGLRENGGPDKNTLFSRTGRFAMECGHSLNEWFTFPNSERTLRRLVWTLFLVGSTFSVPVCSGQGFSQPSYTPSVSEAYFFGDSNQVYPNPYPAQTERFTSAPGESRPVADREVRARNRAERRENFRKKFGKKEVPSAKKQTEDSGANSTVTYPDSQRSARFRPSSAIPTSNPMKSPAPFLWDSTIDADKSLDAPIEELTNESITALPFVDPDETTGQNPPVSTSILKEKSDLTDEEVIVETDELILEDVTIPVKQDLLLPDSQPTESNKPGMAPVEKLLPKSEEITVPDSDVLPDSELVPDSESVPASTPSVNRISPLQKVRAGIKAEASRNAERPTAEKTEPEVDFEEESFNLILEPVPENGTDSRKNLVPETTDYFRDTQVQQTAFFSKEGAVQYPVSGSRIKPGEKSVEKKKETEISAQKQVSSPMVYTSREAQPTETQAVRETSSEINAPVARNLRRQSVPVYRNYPHSTASHRESRQESHQESVVPQKGTPPQGVVPKETLPKEVTPGNSPVSVSGTTDSATPVPESNPETIVYNPPFPELNTPIHRINLTLPVRNVFRDFGLRKEVDKSSLPWYANYIRELDVNEEHLFNSMRVLGNTKLSQSRCQFSLMEASIIASQPQSAQEANRLLNIYENIEAGVLQKLKVVDEQTKLTTKQKEEIKAELILDFMHQNVFVKYVLEGTTITNLLDHGYYNCVTASLLYCSLAEKAGLNVTAVELPGHAMCWVYLADGERLEVETTCSNWFKYRNDPETQQKVICKLIRDASPQLKDQSDKMLLLQIPQPISDKRLIAKIYYNRGVDLLSASDYAGALEANVIAYCLDPQSKTTFGNLLATMNNWAIALCREGKYKEATALLRTGLRYQPDYPPFKNNHTHVYHHWVDSLYRSGHMQEALQIANLAASEQPEVEHFKRIQAQIQQSIATLNQVNTATK